MSTLASPTTYNLTAVAPPGWTVTINTTGMVTVTPEPGLQAARFLFQVVAQSTDQPKTCLAQTTVNIAITPTRPASISA